MNAFFIPSFTCLNTPKKHHFIPEKNHPCKEIAKRAIKTPTGRQKPCKYPSLSVRLAMLHMQTDKHQDWTRTEAGNGTHSNIYPKRIKLFAGYRLNHTVQFFKMKTGMTPKLG
jgi:hypothetical protein